MDPLKITIILSIIAAISLTVCWLDHKKGWQLADWINGRCSNPFTQTQKTTKTRNNKRKSYIFCVFVWIRFCMCLCHRTEELKTIDHQQPGTRHKIQNRVGSNMRQ